MKIFVTRKIPEPGLNLLRKEYELEIYECDRVPTKEEIIKGLRGKDGLLCLLTDPIDGDVIYSEPKLKMIASYAVGYNNIDIQAATKRRIPVSNTPDVLTDTTAEMTWALLFSVARRIVEGDRFARAGKFTGWAPMLMLGQDVSNKTLGIIGAGRIGTAFAMKSKGFKMNVLYADEKQNDLLERELGAKKVSFDDLIKRSDYRGPVIDEKALAKALKEKRIFGAGLDVYEQEPSIEKELLELDNVVLQPHSASATTETRTKMAIMAAENMIAGLSGKIPPNCINPEVFKKK
ncbi:MAG: D-glycerate dehydrogenase [Euryarchaeota archaeon]|nr:D-glycerate dehydrogenase [Euryarchaeota archaeon]